jgi:hypothetical protein
MKYIVAFKRKSRKNAKRHVATLCGRVEYFGSIDEARKHFMFSHPDYTAEVLTSNYKAI